MNEPKRLTFPTAAAAPAIRQWSSNQEAIFEFVAAQEGSSVVIAVAGSGKTTTIVEAARRLPRDTKAKFVAFNKSIADELHARLPGHVAAQTLNAMGFRAWREHLSDNANACQLNSNKTRFLIRALMDEGDIAAQEFNLFCKAMPRLIGLAKAAGLVPAPLAEQYNGLLDDDDEFWTDTVELFGLDVEANMDDPTHTARLREIARLVLTRSIEQAETLIDFDDQLYMPVISNARFEPMDLIFVDEAQDLNAMQRAMLRRALKPGGRLIAVGDPYQAIYGFRGACSDSIQLIKRDFNAGELPLTISYRCPKAVVRLAQQWVDHIEAGPNAPDGQVETLDGFSAATFRNTDAILCRNTKPLVALAFALLRDGKPCKIRGRDIGSSLVALIKRIKGPQTVGQFEHRFGQYVSERIGKLYQQNKDDMAQRLQDQADTMAIFLDEVRADAPIADLIQKIESTFSDSETRILTLSTIHKAKGLEFERVFVLDPWLMPSKYATTPDAQQQESNLQYVAVTRAKAYLAYIESVNYKGSLVI